MRTLLTAIFLMGSFISKAQEKPEIQPKKLQQFYVGFGSGGAYTNAKNLDNSYEIFSTNLTATFRNNYTYRLGYFHSYFQDNLQSVPDGEKFSYMAPYHDVSTTYFVLGKTKPISKYINFKALAGLAYTRYHERYNITLRNYSGDIFFMPVSGTAIDYETKKHNKTGIFIQTEFMLLVSRAFGITTGAYYHFVPNISNGGFLINLNLGRIRTKETKIL
jgi:hypothetical protein